MKTSRTDIEISRKSIKCPNSSLIGYSSWTLKKGDLFLYKEYYTDGTTGKRLAKCHGLVKPITGDKWMILAQAASNTMGFTMERWVDAVDVLETTQKQYINPLINAFFEQQEKLS